MKDIQLVKRLEGHEWTCSALEFHPSSNMLASTSWDRTIRVWDVADGHVCACLAGCLVNKTSPPTFFFSSFSLRLFLASPQRDYPFFPANRCWLWPLLGMPPLGVASD